MSLSPYRQTDEAWYQLYLAEACENAALRREIDQLRENRLAVIQVVRVPANDNTEPPAPITPIDAVRYLAVSTCIFACGIAMALTCFH